jgi:hypothetical protein
MQKCRQNFGFKNIFFPRQSFLKIIFHVDNKPPKYSKTTKTLTFLFLVEICMNEEKHIHARLRGKEVR